MQTHAPSFMVFRWKRPINSLTQKKKQKNGSCCHGGELLNRQSTVMNFGLIPTLKRCFPAFGMWFGACIHVNKSPEARQWQDGLGCSGLTQLQLKSTQFKMDLTFPTTVSSEAKQAYFLICQPQNAYFKHISQLRPAENAEMQKVFWMECILEETDSTCTHACMRNIFSAVKGCVQAEVSF